MFKVCMNCVGFRKEYIQKRHSRPVMTTLYNVIKVIKHWFQFRCSGISLHELSLRRTINLVPRVSALERVAGADPGEVKWVNFHPRFFETPSFFFFLIRQILK